MRHLLIIYCAALLFQHSAKAQDITRKNNYLEVDMFSKLKVKIESDKTINDQIPYYKTNRIWISDKKKVSWKEATIENGPSQHYDTLEIFDLHWKNRDYKLALYWHPMYFTIEDLKKETTHNIWYPIRVYGRTIDLTDSLSFWHVRMFASIQRIGIEDGYESFAAYEISITNDSLSEPTPIQKCMLPLSEYHESEEKYIFEWNGEKYYLTVDIMDTQKDGEDYIIFRGYLRPYYEVHTYSLTSDLFPATSPMHLEMLNVP